MTRKGKNVKSCIYCLFGDTSRRVRDATVVKQPMRFVHLSLVEAGFLHLTDGFYVMYLLLVVSQYT